VLESGEVMRLGSLAPKKIDIRVIAATNRDLADLAGQGRFREDLYFRLNGITIRVPPLRERISEVANLARTFAAEACRRSNRPALPGSRAALAGLEGHRWPGNVRELRNVMDRAVVLCQTGTIEPEHVLLEEPARREAPPSKSASPEPSEAEERARIVAALEE